MKRYGIILLLAFTASVAWAEDYHVRPNGGNYGREDGTDWNNAFDGFSGIRWGEGPGQVGAGDVLYVAGGTYSNNLDPQIGGSETNRLIIRRATNSKHGTEVGWVTSFDRQVLLKDVGILIKVSNLTIDGQVANGIRIHRTVRGAAGVSWPSVASNNVTLRYLQIEGPGYRIHYNGIFGSRGIDLTPSSGISRNILIEYCDIFNQPSQIYFLNVDGVTVQYCEFHHGDDLTTGAQADHENVIYADASDNVVVRYNAIHDYAAEGIFLRAGPDNWNIYGNIFYNGGLGVECRQDVGPHKNVNIFNNVFVNLVGPIRYRGTGDTGNAKNNIIYPNAGGIIWGPGIMHDYNWYGGNDKQGEAHGIAGGNENPFINSANFNFHLKSGASPIDKGTNLGVSFNTDKDGITRPRGGAWDIGAFEFDSGSRTGVSNDPSAKVPDVPELDQNYPNPFNPSTSISFRLPAPEEVKLNVYNALGQQVATLMEASLKAGRHSFDWVPQGLASGIYYYRMEAGNFVLTKKMLLSR